MITTHNEPWVMSVLGHETGVFAPGVRNRGVAMQVAHHLLLSHGLALRSLRAQGCRVPLGIVLNLSPVYPSGPGEAHAARARLEDGRLVRWYMDPLFGRGYPQDVLADLGPDAPVVGDGDMAVIAQPLDYLGVNYYSRCVVGADGPWDATRGGLALTDMGWEIFPRGLTDLLVRLHHDYPLPPVYLTENGAAFPDVVQDGRVHDAARIDYIAAHVRALAEASSQGVPVAGYMVWSLLDNFEWASGYGKRFGIVHVDYATQRRTLKDSALWYRDFLAARTPRSGASAGPQED
jgi:beta-glucosidase